MGYLVERVLNKTLDKSTSVRLSKWSKKDVSCPQMDYAALDVLKPLGVYIKISTLPDLNTRHLILLWLCQK
jgi:ribonuclease D